MPKTIDKISIIMYKLGMTVESIFATVFDAPRPNHAWTAWLWKAVQPVFVFIMLYVVGHMIVNARAITEQAQSAWKYDVLAEHQSIKQTKVLPTVKVAVPEAKTVPTSEDNQLIIPKLNITVPVSWQIGPSESAMLDALKNSVIQLSGTANPGEVGNVFIAGHSSSYWWDKSQHYPTVFANLARLTGDDKIVLHYKQHEYVYAVTGQKVVAPTDTSVLNATNTPTLSLMTCTPTGTALKRLVITAKQVEPAPSAASTNAANQPTAAVLPAAR